MKPAAHSPGIDKKQSGAALIVGLILMLVASIVAMSSMRGSTLQERMTANLNNEATAFMAAEAGATAAFTLLEAGLWQVGSLSDQGVTDDGGTYAYTIEFGFGGDPNVARVLARGERTGTGARAELEALYSRSYSFAETITTSESVPSDAPQELQISGAGIAAFSCFGPQCVTKLQGSPTINGYDHPVPVNFFCTGAGCKTSPDMSKPGTKGVYMPDGGSLNSKKADAVKGSPPSKLSRDTDFGNDADSEKYHYAEFWSNFVNTLLGRIPASEYSGSVSTGDLGTRHAPKATVLKQGAKVNGNVAGAGVLIVEAGATFNGTMHFEGLVILMPGANFGTGNASFYGAVVALSDDGGTVDYDSKGNFDTLYSSEALRNVQNWIDRETSEDETVTTTTVQTIDVPSRLVTWRQIL